MYLGGNRRWVPLIPLRLHSYFYSVEVTETYLKPRLSIEYKWNKK